MKELGAMKNCAPLCLALVAACNAPCNTLDGGGRFCLPDSGVSRAGGPITLQIDGTFCDATCGVTVDGGTIKLETFAVECRGNTGEAAAIACTTVSTCTVPPLAPGDYTVISDGTGPGILHVVDGGTGALNACTLFAQ